MAPSGETVAKMTEECREKGPFWGSVLGVWGDGESPHMKTYIVITKARMRHEAVWVSKECPCKRPCQLGSQYAEWLHLMLKIEYYEAQ